MSDYEKETYFGIMWAFVIIGSPILTILGLISALGCAIDKRPSEEVWMCALFGPLVVYALIDNYQDIKDLAFHYWSE